MEKAEQLIKEQYLLEYNHFRTVTGLKLNYTMRVVDQERLFMEKRIRKAWFKFVDIEEAWGAGDRDSRTESVLGSKLGASFDQKSEQHESASDKPADANEVIEPSVID